VHAAIVDLETITVDHHAVARLPDDPSDDDSARFFRVRTDDE
jgi:hypothetical protein